MSPESNTSVTTGPNSSFYFNLAANVQAMKNEGARHSSLILRGVLSISRRTHPSLAAQLENQKRTSHMKKIVRSATPAILPLLLMAASPLVHAERWYVCSVASLNGAYAAVISGQIATPSGPIAISGVSMGQYDGQGHYSGVDHIVRAGTQPPTDWRPGTGTYTVNPDCTGTAHITFEGGGPPLDLHFVIAKFGATFRAVVSTPAANITAEGVKVEQQ
jgi:hypothetical protein